MWISGFTFIFLSILLPETLEANILLRRAHRLRKLTGNSELRSQSEIDQAAISKKDFIYESLVQPFILAADPALLFANVFIGLVCKFIFTTYYVVRLRKLPQMPPRDLDRSYIGTPKVLGVPLWGHLAM